MIWLHFWQVPGTWRFLDFGDTLTAAILVDLMGAGETIQMIGYIHAVSLCQPVPDECCHFLVFTTAEVNAASVIAR
jgi:hypothetical protein